MLYQGKQKLLLKMLVTTLLLVTFFVVIVQWWFLKHMKSLETEMTFLLRKGFDKKFSGSNGWLFQTKHFKNKIHFKLQNYLVLQEVISICLQLEWTWQQFALMVEPSWMSILICYNNILHNIVNCFFRMWTTSNCNLYRVVLNCWGGLNAKFWKLQQHFHKCSRWFLCMSISKKS